jgi:hypothetical protein
MNKVSRQAPKRHAPEVAHESHLLQALKGAKLPATQSALSRISNHKADFKQTPALSQPQTSSADASGITPFSETAESSLRAVAQSLQAWRSLLPPHLQPSLLALVHGGLSIDVQSIAFCAPDSIRLCGSCQGRAYKLFAPASEIQFLCVPNANARAGTAACIVFDFGSEVLSA